VTRQTVKLDKLVKQLQREAAGNPKKTGVLGLMALVALYFWAPLVWQWLVPSGEKKKPVNTSETALILTDDPAEPSQQARTRKANRFRWDKVRQAIRDDQHMVSAMFDVGWADPFGGTVAVSPVVPANPVAEAAASDVGPEDAGLVLTSVLIGARQRTATINGETYREGDLVVAGPDDATQSLVFRLARIGPRAIDLERNRRTYTVELQLPKLASGDEIERTSKGRRD
jgi:hypothetical protein